MTRVAVIPNQPIPARVRDIPLEAGNQSVIRFHEPFELRCVPLARLCQNLVLSEGIAPPILLVRSQA